MHELGMARSIAAIIGEHANGRPVKAVRVAIGPLACIERQALSFCWDIVTEKTGLAGASLGFIEAEGDIFTVKEFEFRED